MIPTLLQLHGTAYSETNLALHCIKSKPSVMKMTPERLNLEYIQWTTVNGIGRDDNDIRFGQYIHNKYDLPVKVDVFYTEKADRSYSVLLNWLSEESIQNVL